MAIRNFFYPRCRASYNSTYSLDKFSYMNIKATYTSPITFTIPIGSTLTDFAPF